MSATPISSVSRSVHEIVESHVGEKKAISAASFTHYSDSGFTREQIFSAVGPFLKRRFVTDDNTQALVTAFIPTMVRSSEMRRTGLMASTPISPPPALGDAQVAGLHVLTTYASTDIIGSLRNGLDAGGVRQPVRHRPGVPLLAHRGWYPSSRTSCRSSGPRFTSISRVPDCR